MKTELEKRVDELLAMSPEEFGRLVDECHREADRISRNFEEKMRLPPGWENLRITI